MTVSESIQNLNQYSANEEVEVIPSDCNLISRAGYSISNIYAIQGHNDASGVYIEVQKHFIRSN